MDTNGPVHTKEMSTHRRDDERTKRKKEPVRDTRATRRGCATAARRSNSRLPPTVAVGRLPSTRPGGSSCASQQPSFVEALVRRGSRGKHRCPALPRDLLRRLTCAERSVLAFAGTWLHTTKRLFLAIYAADTIATLG